MKLLINVSNNLGGGGLQVALSILNELQYFPENEYHVCISNKIISQVLNKNHSFIKYYIIDKSSIFTISKLMKTLEKKIKPDVVFSIFAPTYWRPKNKHIAGFAIPHYLYSDSPFYQTLKIIDKLKLFLKKMIHINLINWQVDAIICETDDATKRSMKVFNKNKRYYTVSNTYNHFFGNECKRKLFLPITNDTIRFVTISNYYKHKNLDIIPNVVELLTQKNIFNFEFILTINEKDYSRIIPEKYRKYVKNIGPISVSDCPSLYNECDIMFLPSLLECFSANYPEAMIMGKPILTSDLGFAHTVCNEAALYFNPLSPQDISEKIIEIINNKKLFDQLKENGFKRVKDFPTANERVKQYLDICKEIIK